MRIEDTASFLCRPLPPSPPPVKADGSPLAEGEELPKEKSFVAKYWYCECSRLVMIVCTVPDYSLLPTQTLFLSFFLWLFQLNWQTTLMKIVREEQEEKILSKLVVRKELLETTPSRLEGQEEEHGSARCSTLKPTLLVCIQLKVIHPYSTGFLLKQLSNHCVVLLYGLDSFPCRF